MNQWPDSSTLATVASIIAAFSVAMLSFRVERELRMRQAAELNWIPCADWLLLLALLCALLLVILPLVAAPPSSWVHRYLPGPSCAAAVVLLAAYPFAILAHYQFIFAFGRKLPRSNPEPSEAVIVVLALLLAAGTAWWAYALRAL